MERFITRQKKLLTFCDSASRHWLSGVQKDVGRITRKLDRPYDTEVVTWSSGHAPMKLVGENLKSHLSAIGAAEI